MATQIMDPIRLDRIVPGGLINDVSVAVVAWLGGKFYECCNFPDLEILNRDGGGDSFASGFNFGLMNSGDPQIAGDCGAVYQALAMPTPGDASKADQGEVENLRNGGGSEFKDDPSLN